MSENIIDHEETTEKESLKTKLSNFYQKHKTAIVVGGSAVGGIVTAAVLKSLISDDSNEPTDETSYDGDDELLWTVNATVEEALVLDEKLSEIRDTSVEEETPELEESIEE